MHLVKLSCQKQTAFLDVREMRYLLSKGYHLYFMWVALPLNWRSGIYVENLEMSSESTSHNSISFIFIQFITSKQLKEWFTPPDNLRFY
jgi:hypothetical protein